MKKKILFLDIDGVLNCTRLSLSSGQRNPSFHLDSYVIDFLNMHCREGNLQIVISSTWRQIHGEWDLKQMLALAGGHEMIKAMHPDWKTELGGDVRGDQIQKWLAKHDVESDGYIILDDDSDMLPHQMSRFIKTTHKNGMQCEQYMQFNKLMGFDEYRLV